MTSGVNSLRILKALAVLAVVVFCLQTFSDNKADVDLWGNVGFVTVWPWSPGFHYENTFSFTEPDMAWVNHEWLAQYILHHTHAYLGNTGLLGLKIILGLSVIFLLNFSMSVDCKSGIVRFFLLLLIVSTMGYGFSTRPHHFTYLMAALCLLMLKRCPRNTFWPLLVMPVFGLLWVNLHGAFFIGALLGGAYGLLELATARHAGQDARATRRHAFVILGSTALFVVATLANPYGLKTWAFIVHSAGTPRPYLSEWAAFHPVKHAVDHVDFMVLALIALLSLPLPRLRGDLVWTGILLLSLLSALLLRRNIPLFALTAGFVIAGPLGEWVRPRVSITPGPVKTAILTCLLAVFVVLSTHYALRFNKTNPLEIEVQRDKFPVGTVRFMQANRVRGNALVFFDWAEYCIWKLYPDCRVFLDGRFLSAYSAPLADEYLNFLYLGKDWQKALVDRATDIVLVHKQNPVADVMLLLQDWSLAYEGQVSHLYLKKTRHAKLLADLKDGKVVYPAGGNREVYFP